ncbi:Sperm motility kinase X [Lemmus lemmus]
MGKCKKAQAAEPEDPFTLLSKCNFVLEEQVHRIFTQIVHAVNYCQENSVAHRDIKPDNILLDGKGSVRLCDFGLTIKVTSGQEFKGCGMVSPDIQCVTEMGHPAGSDQSTMLAEAPRVIHCSPTQEVMHASPCMQGVSTEDGTQAPVLRMVVQVQRVPVKAWRPQRQCGGCEHRGILLQSMIMAVSITRKARIRAQVQPNLAVAPSIRANKKELSHLEDLKFLISR